MRHDKKNAKHGNNTIIQKPAIKAGLTFGVSIIGARINMLQPRPGDTPLKVGNDGQGYQVVAYQVLGNDPSGHKRHSRRNALAVHELPRRGGAFAVSAHGNADNVGRLHLRIQPAYDKPDGFAVAPLLAHGVTVAQYAVRLSRHQDGQPAFDRLYHIVIHLAAVASAAVACAGGGVGQVVLLWGIGQGDSAGQLKRVLQVACVNQQAGIAAAQGGVQLLIVVDAQAKRAVRAVVKYDVNVVGVALPHGRLNDGAFAGLDFGQPFGSVGGWQQ